MLCFRFKMSTTWIQGTLSRGVSRAIGHALAYGAFGALFRLIALSMVTYFLMSSKARFQEISDVISSNELLIIGLGSLSYLLMLRILHPLTSTTLTEVFTPYRFERKFAPGFFHGAVLASGFVLALLISGFYHYIGFFVQSADAPLAALGVATRIIILGVLVYCEEFIFRHKILNYMRRHIPDFYAALICSAAYCVIKLTQLDLGIMHMITLFLLAMSLSFRSIQEGDFVRGAGFFAGLLIVFHPMLSLPILGNDFPGIVMIKHHLNPDDSEIARFLTGGAGGPLSSFALQLLLLFDVTQTIIRNKIKVR